ncbi:rhodanese-like domain-containing protein [Pseudonocardia pini]|uniref:rhodanese-like domain-containing protein n=1 Tax=Pseudonocardia pini TaxID=2758030 RepID=UPI001FE77161|nr:rhodanese-like domain-containing protein [Pseudonocardia pini]
MTITTTTDAAAFFAAKLAFETDVSDVRAALASEDAEFVLVDTRSRAAWDQGHIPGAVHLPTAELPGGLDPSRPVVTYCWGPGCNGATRGALGPGTCRVRRQGDDRRDRVLDARRVPRRVAFRHPLPRAGPAHRPLRLLVAAPQARCVSGQVRPQDPGPRLASGSTRRTGNAECLTAVPLCTPAHPGSHGPGSWFRACTRCNAEPASPREWASVVENVRTCDAGTAAQVGTVPGGKACSGSAGWRWCGVRWICVA